MRQRLGSHLRLSHHCGGYWCSDPQHTMSHTFCIPRWPQCWRIHLPMQETQVQSLGREDPLQKEEATHSSILAWRMPWTEELGGLQSRGSQRVGHDWSDLAHVHIACRDSLGQKEKSRAFKYRKAGFRIPWDIFTKPWLIFRTLGHEKNFHRYDSSYLGWWINRGKYWITNQAKKLIHFLDFYSPLI